MNFGRRYSQIFALKRGYSSIDTDLKPPQEPINESHYHQLSDAVTPLWRLPYPKQLEFKQNWSRNLLKVFRQKLFHKGRIKLHNIIPSPSAVEYRNKDEFSVRIGSDGNPKTVGFFIGSHKEGSVVCIPPTYLTNIKKKHIEVAKLYQDFLRESPLPVCQDLHDGGYWRGIIVRSNIIGETMAAVIAHPHGASESSVKEGKDHLTQFFSKSGLIESLHLQSCPHTRSSDEKYPFEILFGKPHIYEQIDDYLFRISPDSFFQVNTEAASELYKTILRFAVPSKKSTLLDLCCGIGTLSIFANKSVRGCVGIDICQRAVKDAAFNANNNNVNNCSFIAGRVEKKLTPLLQDLNSSSEIVAVLNPGRSGVGNFVIKALRRCFQINRIVYVSCKADNPYVMQNFKNLCSPAFDSSSGFMLTDVQPLDMFPQTNHCENILLFRR